MDVFRGRGGRIMLMSHTITSITSKPFDNPHIRKILDRVINKINYQYLHQLPGHPLFVDPFANDSFTQYLQGCITNDLNPKFNTNYNLEFKDFAYEMKELEHKFDLILFDPPYSLRQLKDQYDGIGKELKLWQTHNMWGEGKDVLADLVKVGGYVISLGWTTAGFGQKRGFQKKEVHVFEQAAREDRYSMYVVVEQKTQTKLELQFEGIEEE